MSINLWRFFLRQNDKIGFKCNNPLLCQNNKEIQKGFTCKRLALLIAVMCSLLRFLVPGMTILGVLWTENTAPLLQAVK
jgi:hypothetical protein